jgi:L-2,4-diaminobutyrate decarboxylase
MNALEKAFDPERFRSEGHRVVDLLADMLRSEAAGEGAVLPWASPEDELAHWEGRMAEPPQPPSDFIAEVIARSIKLHHPRYMGHQVCAPAPDSALAGLASELLINGMAVYEMGPASNALEQWIVRQTCGRIGFSNGDGFLTSGGTLGTLTALLAARSKMAAHGQEVAVIASEEAHYCTARAVEIMGGDRQGLVTVPVDDRFKMRTDLLGDALEEAARRGRRPVVLVASACSTSTGSYDDIGACADFCERHGLWLHVDGAHGAAVAFHPGLRDRIAGIERACSVVLDFHKLLLTPALATAVMFREPGDSWAAFHQQARYLFQEGESDAWKDSGRRTLECTKLGMSLKIAALWRASGEEVFREHLAAVHALAKDFAAILRSRPPFEVAVEPESNIVCFRLTPPGCGGPAADELNARARATVVGSGAFYIVQTVLRGRLWLRAALMNPFTTPRHLAAMLDAVEAAAKPR